MQLDVFFFFKTRPPGLQDELGGFFRSARVRTFVSFLMYFTFMMAASVLLHYRESRYWWQHIFSMTFWILMALVRWRYFFLKNAFVLQVYFYFFILQCLNQNPKSRVSFRGSQSEFCCLSCQVFVGLLGAQESSEQMAEFGRGYFIELTLSMENVFVYEMILVSFRVPRRVAKDMLYVVSFFQMFFQLWLFMFMAKLLQGASLFFSSQPW